MGRLVAITGGIGSGKSVVSRILEIQGYPVYDCDSGAKLLMVKKDCLDDIAAAFGEEAVKDGRINSPYIASIVFNDVRKLKELNAIVHPRVAADLKSWAQSQSSEVVFVETAILKESGLDRVVDAIWIVDAPVDVRIERVMKRNGLSEKEVVSRIEKQAKELCFDVPSYVIVNDNKSSLIGQVDQMLRNKLY